MGTASGMDSAAGVALGDVFFRRDVAVVARDLLGCLLVVGRCAGRIVEVERYERADPASHSHRGPTPRCLTMFGPPGRLYVYRSYGIHWCANVVVGEEGDGAAVLVRALEPVAGLEVMRERRGLTDPRLLCSGPGRLTQALGVDGSFDGEVIGGDRVRILRGTRPAAVLCGPRIGIRVATEVPWRLGVADSRYLSRSFPKEALE